MRLFECLVIFCNVDLLDALLLFVDLLPNVVKERLNVIAAILLQNIVYLQVIQKIT